MYTQVLLAYKHAVFLEGLGIGVLILAIIGCAVAWGYTAANWNMPDTNNAALGSKGILSTIVLIAAMVFYGMSATEKQFVIPLAVAQYADTDERLQPDAFIDKIDEFSAAIMKRIEGGKHE